MPSPFHFHVLPFFFIFFFGSPLNPSTCYFLECLPILLAWPCTGLVQGIIAAVRAWVPCLEHSVSHTPHTLQLLLLVPSSMMCPELGGERLIKCPWALNSHLFSPIWLVMNLCIATQCRKEACLAKAESSTNIWVKTEIFRRQSSCPFGKTIVIVSLLWPRSHGLLTRFIVSGLNFLLWNRTQIRKAAGSSHNLLATITSVGTSYLAGWQCSFQDPVLGETIYDPTPIPVTCKVLLSTVKISQPERSSQFKKISLVRTQNVNIFTCRIHNIRCLKGLQQLQQKRTTNK